IKLMTGFGFLEYEDPMDARDVVPAYHGTMLNGSRLTVQFARGSRQRDTFTAPDRTHPRPRRTAHRMQITGLPGETSWQDLKDFARRSGLDVVFSEVGRDRDGKGFVEFETDTDLKTAVEKLDNTDFKGTNVHCYADTQDEVPRDRYRSRSPLPRRNGGGYGAPADDYYGRRGPPPDRGYGERRDDYRRSSPRREYYESPTAVRTHILHRRIDMPTKITTLTAGMSGQGRGARRPLVMVAMMIAHAIETLVDLSPSLPTSSRGVMVVGLVDVAVSSLVNYLAFLVNGSPVCEGGFVG
ncbi:MAG: pre-mRNA splicing factor, partial [Lasallia pustulata]